MRKFDEKNISLSYKESPIAELTRKAIEIPLKRFPIMLKNYVFVIDDDTKDVIILFPLNDLNKANKDLKKIVLDDLKNNITNSGLKIKDEKVLLHDIYKVGFMSQSFRIKCT